LLEIDETDPLLDAAWQQRKGGGWGGGTRRSGIIQELGTLYMGNILEKGKNADRNVLR
jgi:hypothetical protein